MEEIADGYTNLTEYLIRVIDHQVTRKVSELYALT
jgi:hypothetical protein